MLNRWGRSEMFPDFYPVDDTVPDTVLCYDGSRDDDARLAQWLLKAWACPTCALRQRGPSDADLAVAAIRPFWHPESQRLQ